MTLASHTEIAIGCHVRPITEWKQRYKAIGRAEGYSAAQIEEYGEYIALAEKYAVRMRESNAN